MSSEYIPVPDEEADAEATGQKLVIVNPAANGHATKLDIINATAFMAVPLKEPDQVVKGILHKGCKFSIGGSSKACKTWAMLDLALSVNAGVNWLGFETTQGRVLYVNFEIQSFAWQQRIKTVAKAREITNLGNIDLLNLRGKISDFYQLIPQIIETMKGKGYALIIIDPIYKLYGDKTDENSARDTNVLLNQVERIATETGAAVAYASHFSKGNQAAKDPMDRVSGSGVFVRDPDCFLTLTKHSQEGCFTVDAVLRNFAPIQPFVVKWEFPVLTTELSLNPDDLKRTGGRPPTYSEKDVLGALNAKSLSTSEFKKVCYEEMGISRTSFYRILKELEGAGKIIHQKTNQKWALIHKSEDDQTPA